MADGSPVRSTAPLPGAQPLATAAEMRALEADAADRASLPSRLLMENAGAAAARVAVRLLRRAAPARARRAGRPTAASVAVVAGKGQNGGDGLAAARHLRARGVDLTVFGIGAVGSAGDSLLARRALAAAGVDVTPWTAPVAADLARFDLVIDALLGTGARAPIEGEMAAAIEAINAAGRPVLALDLPSGVNADTGGRLGPCVDAAVTLAFGLAKPGLYLNPGAACAGRVHVDPIGLPAPALAQGGGTLWRVGGRCARRLLPGRPPDAHKGTFGHLVVVAGSSGFEGAALLAALAGLRAGAGLVTLVAPEPTAVVLAGRVPEVMVRRAPAGPDGAFAPSAADAVAAICANARAVAIGPGLGPAAPFVRELTRRLAGLGGRSSARPLPAIVLDADGLRAFAGDLAGLRALGLRLVLTPHPGEMAALCGRALPEVQADRPGFALRAAEEAAAVVVHKGAPSVVATPGGPLYLNGSGGVALATAGTGDVLTGTIGALLANGLDLLPAACAGVYLHGLAGDLTAARQGRTGALAGDVAGALPAARAHLEREVP